MNAVITEIENALQKRIDSPYSHGDFYFLAKDVLEKSMLLRFRATGSSMSPFIRNGDIVIIGHCSNLSVGDVILFRTAEGRLLLHRIAKKDAKGVVTRGDSADSSDDFIPYANILGKIMKVSGGYNFHLRNPFKYLIGKRIIFSEKLSRFPLIIRLGKIAADFLG